MLGYDGNVPDNWHAIPHGEGLQQVSKGNPSMRGTHPSKGGIPAFPEGRSTPPLAADVVDRMREVVGVRLDIELAERLNLGRSAPSNWRSRNRIPVEECLKLAVEKGVSLDWLLFGEGLEARDANDEWGADVPQGHVALAKLQGYDASPGPERLIFPEVVLRQRLPHGDLGTLRWMANPTDALSPRLPQGRLLLVDTAVTDHESVVDGETYVVRMWGRVNVRRIFIIGPNEYRLRGDSELEERRDLTGPDYQHLEIGGRVIDAI